VSFLTPGQIVTVCKRQRDGRETVRYPAVVSAVDRGGDWFAVQADWTMPQVDSHGLTFAPGDRLLEWFSPSHWYNVFHVHAGDGTYRGWYANITHPVEIEFANPRQVVVTWPDLYLDLIQVAGQSIQRCDDDELDASGLAESDPMLHARILQTVQEAICDADCGKGPFGWSE